jgi:hypothetical protein
MPGTGQAGAARATAAAVPRAPLRALGRRSQSAARRRPCFCRVGGATRRLTSRTDERGRGVGVACPVLRPRWVEAEATGAPGDALGVRAGEVIARFHATFDPGLEGADWVLLGLNVALMVGAKPGFS